MRPLPDGLGLTFDEAIAQAAAPIEEDGFGYSEETLRYHWSHNSEMHLVTFSRPLYTLPD